jgi:hypothetical protein
MLTPARVLTAALVTTLALPAAGRAQSAADILNRMLSEYERRSQGVENYTIVQETMGIETVTYFEKETVDGHPVFRLRSTRAAGMVMTEHDSENDGWDEFYSLAPQMISHAEYLGRDQVEGRAVQVVVVNDLDEIGFGQGPAPEDADFQPELGRFYVDADQWVVRRMEFEGSMTTQGETHDVKSVADFSDFREIDGMLHPFLMDVTVEGFGEALDPEMREQLEEMKRELEQMPEAQRKMVEQMMKAQIENLEQMGDEGGMKIQIKVKELRVNSGPPGDR